MTMEDARNLLNSALEWVKESFEYFQYTLMEGDWLAALLYVSLLLIILFVILAVLFNGWEMFLSNMPYLTSHPFGLPPSRNYLVRIQGSDAYDFTWKYPYLLVQGSRYRFNTYVIDKDDPMRFQTANGTIFEFEKKPEMIRS